MNDQLLQDIAAHIAQNEGKQDFPYLDNVGNITAGFGQKVDKWDDFRQVNFTNRDTDKPATEAEKRAGYNAMTAAKSTKRAQKAKEFENTTKLTLPKEERNRLLQNRIAADEPKVRAALGSDMWGKSVYDKLTKGQKAVMHDVYYANGSLNNFKKLKDAARDGNAQAMADDSSFTAGPNPDGTPHYNYDRLALNRAVAQGITLDQAKQEVATRHANDTYLPGEYKNLLSNKHSYSGGGTDTQTAVSGQTDSPPTAGDQPDPLEQQAAQLPPPDTPQDQYLADLTGDNTPMAFATMNSALSETDDSAAAPGLSTQPDVETDAEAVPADMDMNTYASDLTGDDTPTQFAPMSAALNDESGLPPDPTLLGGDTSGQMLT